MFLGKRLRGDTHYCQKEETNPTSLKISRTCSRVLPWYSTSMRLWYQRRESCQSWDTVSVAPRADFLVPSQASKSASDRKKSMVAQVKTRSSYQRSKGTRKC